MKIEPKLREWMLTRDPARPDPYGIEQAAQQRLVDQIEAANTEEELAQLEQRASSKLVISKTWSVKE